MAQSTSRKCALSIEALSSTQLMRIFEYLQEIIMHKNMIKKKKNIPPSNGLNSLQISVDNGPKIFFTIFVFIVICFNDLCGSIRVIDFPTEKGFFTTESPTK